MKTFAEAGRMYARHVNLRPKDARLLKRLLSVHLDDLGPLGDAPLDKIEAYHLIDAAAIVLPNGTPQTRNRNAIVPASAILHFAQRNRLVARIPVIEKFKEPTAIPRRPLPGAIDRLIAATSGAQRAFLVLIAYQGWRLSEALSLKWRDISFDRQTMIVFVGKARREKQVPMHSKVAAELLSWQSQAPAGDPAVFPWGTGAKVYAWLRPLCAKLDVRFTPHIGRHEFASRLNEVAKATTDDIVALGTWTSTANVQRYIHSTPEHTRALLEQL